MFNTFKFLFLKLLLVIFMLLGSFYHARRVSNTPWMVDGKGSEICFDFYFEIHKTTMAPK